MAGPGLFGRLKLGLGSMLGDASAKAGQDALRRLDEAGRWLECTFPEGASFRAEAEALGRHGGARAVPARGLLATLAAAERDGWARLADGYADLEAGRAAEAAMAADRVEPIRRSAEAVLRELRGLLEAHRREQRTVWTRFAESEPIVRAGFLAGEVARLPEIPGLPRPDLGAFVGPYEEVLVAVPLEYQSGESDAIAFDPDLVGRDVGAAAAAAPEAERRLTDWLYEAARGYEAALGREGAQRLLGELRNPARLRELRGQRPELFQPQPAMYGGMLGADLLPMLLMLSLFSSDGSGWLPPQATAGGPDYGPPAPGEVGNWLERLGAPQGAELESLVAMSEEPIDVEATEDGVADDGLDDGADFDGGGD